MKKTVYPVLLLAAILSLCLSEGKTQTLDLITDPKDWSKGIGSAWVQYQPLKNWILCSGASFLSNSSTHPQSNFQRQYNTLNVPIENFGTEKDGWDFFIKNVSNEVIISGGVVYTDSNTD